MLTQELDVTADRVVEALVQRGVHVVRLDTADFPIRMGLTAHLRSGTWVIRLEGADWALACSRVASVWYRRPAHFVLEPSLSPAEREFARSEARLGMGGLLRCLDCLWVNHPERLVTAAYKPLQLALAAELGFEVPRSLITNDPEQVRDFWDECEGRIVYKTLSPPVVDPEEGRVVAIYTNLLRAEDLADLETVHNTACLFQQYVQKRVELRLTVIGDEVYTAEIHSQKSESTKIDWRLGYEHLDYAVHHAPRHVRSACLALTRRLGLHFAAIDVILTPDDRYVFLELNANGQWAWLEQHVGLPLTNALVDVLATPLEH